MYRGNMLGGVPARFAGKRVIWNIRCSDTHLYPLATRALARVGGILAGWVPELVVNCSVASRRVHSAIGYDAAPGTVIPNGFDSGTFYPDREERVATRASLGIASDIFLVGTIGRWDSQKAYPILLRALRIARDRGVDFQFLFVGRRLDSENRELAAMIDESKCSRFVETIGHRSDVPNIARALDLHVLSSRTEGFPNVVGETMLSGTPNIVTDVGDSALIVGETGWIVPAEDSEKLAAAIEDAHREWSSRSDEWSDRRASARRRIVENFSLDRMIDSYESIWLKVARKDGLVVS
jgi:glycosyltransferase involved in cell wall biosynthesis